MLTFHNYSSVFIINYHLETVYLFHIPPGFFYAEVTLENKMSSNYNFSGIFRFALFLSAGTSSYHFFTVNGMPHPVTFYIISYCKISVQYVLQKTMHTKNAFYISIKIELIYTPNITKEEQKGMTFQSQIPRRKQRGIKFDTPQGAGYSTLAAVVKVMPA